MYKKILIAAAVFAFASTGVNAQDYKSASREAQRQGWANAGMGIVIGAAGALVGNAVAQAIAPAPQQYYQQPQQYYQQPQQYYQQPQQYYQQPSCQPTRVPSYNAYGQLTEYRTVFLC